MDLESLTAILSSSEFKFSLLSLLRPKIFSRDEEVRDIKDLSWTPFNGDGSEDTTVAPAESNNQFKEYKYSASALPEFTAFQIKIVMKATNSAHAPRIKDLRGLALAV